VTELRATGTFVPLKRLESRRSPSHGAGMNCIRISIAAAVLAIAPLAMAPHVMVTPAAAEAAAFAHWPRQCRGDLRRMCRSVAKDEDKTILTCLQENETKLSRACRKLLQSYGHVPDDPGKRR
jgi:hypothetical protein